MKNKTKRKKKKKKPLFLEAFGKGQIYAAFAPLPPTPTMEDALPAWLAWQLALSRCGGPHLSLLVGPLHVGACVRSCQLTRIDCQPPAPRASGFSSPPPFAVT